MKALKVISTIVLLSLVVVSQKANAQTMPNTNLETQNNELLVTPTQNSNSSTNNENAQKYLNKGLELLKDKNYLQAIKAFNEVIKIQPDNQYAYFLKGISYLQLGKYQQAKADLDKSIELDSSISYTYFFRGMTNYALGNKEKAITDLQTAANLFEKDGKLEMAQKSRDVIERIRNA
ncbi:MAG: tetratricopeptide repeat protein [Cyanobacteria bacterium P01_A01_bin.84]